MFAFLIGNTLESLPFLLLSLGLYEIVFLYKHFDVVANENDCKELKDLMLLITPEILVKMLCPGEYKSFLADMFPSVPDKTRRNLKNGANPSKKTVDAIVADLSAFSSLSEDEIRSFLASQSPQPWKNAIAGYRTAPSSPDIPSFDYVTEIVVRIESAPFKAAAAKQRKDPRWQKQFEATGLPESVMPHSFLETCHQVAKRKKAKKGKRVVPMESGKVLLRTNLFVLAAFEASLLHSDLVRPGVDLWIHKAMPYYREANLIEPMRELFEVIMEKVGVSSIAQFAEQLKPLTVREQDKNVESQKRQIKRWVAGQVPPSWEYMCLIRDSFFGGDDGVLVSYGVTRFLQCMLKELRDQYIPVFFKDEKELVWIFQEYPKWQEYHQKEFGKWTEARSTT